MGLSSSTAAFVRFFVPEPTTEDFWGYVDERLKAGGFRECEGDQESSGGFTVWEDFFEAVFDHGSYHKADYLAFHFRIDQRKVPPLIKKLYFRQAVEKFRAEHEGNWPSRQEKLDIQETTEKWLLSRSFPLPSAVEVVWSPGAQSLLIGTTSSKMIDAFLEHFEKHFQVYPVPLYHVHWALNGLPLDDRRKDVLSSMVNVQSVHALEEGRFIGHEFLTWLWFFAETSHPVIAYGEGQTAEVTLGERMVLTLPSEGKEKVVCTTRAYALHEARTALQQGKLVDEMQVAIKAGDNDYQVTLDSSLFAFKGLKTPKQLAGSDEEDPDGRFLEKMFFLEEVTTILNTLYKKFLDLRLGSEWESETLAQLKEWIASGPDEGEEAPEGAGADNAPF
ncbi:MAG: recombination-associated protein RdgC [Syntrophobacteraceae bacterium]